MSFIIDLNVAWTFVSPKGEARNLNCPYLALKAVNDIATSNSQTCSYPLQKSFLESILLNKAGQKYFLSEEKDRCFWSYFC